MRSDDRKQQFTLVELLAVMAIIAVLSGLIIGVSGFASTSAARAKTVGLMQSMEVALQQYLSDQGHYPMQTTAAALDWTRSEFVNDQTICYLEGFSSPYRDAWRQKFYYQCPGTINTESYDLWSCGPDKKHGDGGAATADAQTRTADNSDDISNWKRN